MSRNMLRMLNQPIKKRFYQGINGLIVCAAGEALKVIHIVEYPKCGGSWIRNMLQTYLGVAPYYYDRLVRPKSVIQTHRLYSRRYSFPVVLFRDPRDVFVSYYFYEKSLVDIGARLEIRKFVDFGSANDIREEFADYLNAKLIHVTDPYFSYRQFVESWFGRPGVCYVTYENFQNAPEQELTKVVTFIGESPDVSKIHDAIEYNNFENTTRRKYGTGRRKGETDPTKFQRKGVSGDWLNYFNDRSCALMKEHLGDILIELGYEKSNDWATHSKKAIV